MKKVVIAGGSGFIGQGIVKRFRAAGYETVVLSRSGAAGSADRGVAWDGRSVGPWAAEIEGADVVINLAGSHLTRRWTAEIKKDIVDSRVESTSAIYEAISAAKIPPGVWINASAIGFYGDTGRQVVSEASPAGTGFLPESCQAWESAAQQGSLPATRRVRIRIGIVLGRGGGMLDRLVKLTKAFAGGAVGTGEQFLSWIHIEDLANMFLWAAEEAGLDGVINGVAPNPVTNAEFMGELRNVLGRPPVPPAPAFMIRLIGQIIGIDPSLLLEGQRVEPTIPLARGFEFKFPELPAALRDLVDETPAAWRESATA